MSQAPNSADGPSEASPLLGSSEHAHSNVQENGTFQTNGKPVPGSDHDVEQQVSDPASAADETPKPHEGLPEVRKRMYVIFPAVAIGVFLGAADQTIIVSSYGQIGTELQALNLTSWIATAYFLTLTSFQPLYGKLSDIFGRKPCLLFCYSVFGLGCLGCGLAQTMPQLIAARAFAGIGGGGMNVVVTVMLSDIVTLRERGKWQGYINLVFAAGSSTGAPLGGLFADHAGWRWTFLAQVPLCALAIIAVSFALKLPKRPEDGVPWTKKLRRVDLLGALILIGAVFSLLVALDRGSNVSWSTPVSYGPLIAAAVLALAFGLVETKVAKEPFAPGHIIFSHSTVACYLSNFFSMAGVIAAMFYTPLYLQVVHGLNSTGAGVCLIPMAISAVLGSLLMGFYMNKTGKYYRMTVFAYGLPMVGMVVLLLFSGLAMNSIAGTIVGMCLSSFGNAAGVTSTLIGLLANVAHEDQALVIACSYLFRSLGCVFGVSLSATMANQVLKTGLKSRLPEIGLPKSKATEIALKVRESLKHLRGLEPSIKAVVTSCYQNGIRAAFSLELGFAVCAFVAAWFIVEKPLSR